MTTQQINRDALDVQQEGRGLCRVLVWAAVLACISLAAGAYGSQSTRFVTIPSALFPMGTMATSTARLPAEYQEVEYLQSTGTQYIDSGFVPTEQTKVEAKWIGTSNGRLYGYYSHTVGFTSIVGADGGAAGWICKDKTVNINISWGTVYTSIHDATGVLTNGYVAATYTGVTAFTSAGTMYIFAQNKRAAPNFIGSLYYLKAWSGSTMIRDYVPCRRISDSVLGLYDRVNATFSQNLGTGTFAAGPDVQ